MGIEIGQVLAIGGPTSVVTAILVILINAYLSARKDRREQQASDVATESSIVDNAKKVLELVRNETDRMEYRIIELSDENKRLAEQNRQLEQHVNSQDDIIARQQRQLEFVAEDLRRAREEIAQLRAETGGRGSASQAPRA